MWLLVYPTWRGPWASFICIITDIHGNTPKGRKDILRSWPTKVRSLLTTGAFKCVSVFYSVEKGTNTSMGNDHGDILRLILLLLWQCMVWWSADIGVPCHTCYRYCLYSEEKRLLFIVEKRKGRSNTGRGCKARILYYYLKLLQMWYP